LKFNGIAHKNLDKGKFLQANTKNISSSLEFLFDCSELFNQYIFDEVEEDEESQKSKNIKCILPIDIFNDFKDLNEKYSKTLKEF